jgi:hypothetical protein
MIFPERDEVSYDVRLVERERQVEERRIVERKPAVLRELIVEHDLAVDVAVEVERTSRSPYETTYERKYAKRAIPHPSSSEISLTRASSIVSDERGPPPGIDQVP